MHIQSILKKKQFFTFFFIQEFKQLWQQKNNAKYSREKYYWIRNIEMVKYWCGKNITRKQRSVRIHTAKAEIAFKGCL